MSFVLCCVRRYFFASKTFSDRRRPDLRHRTPRWRFGCAATALGHYRTNPLIMEFLDRYLLFSFSLAFRWRPTWPIVAIVSSIAGILLAGNALSENWKRLIGGIPCGIILAGAVSLERTVSVPKILVALGASSYSLLFHSSFVPRRSAKLGHSCTYRQKCQLSSQASSPLAPP
jgi:hypothetical protein